jgi:tRNA (mo5U34)-methyltransferase
MDLSSLASLVKGTTLDSLTPFLSEAYLAQIRHGDFPRWRQRLAQLPVIDASIFVPGDRIQIGAASDADAATLADLEARLREFIPWRKGPFELFGIHIDSEWRCNLKWDRLSHKLGSLQGQKLLDVGSGNGYFGFRMLAAGADLVIGIDPHLAYVAQFWAAKHFLPKLPIYVLPLTLEQFPRDNTEFDTVFSMGVLYHRRSPIDHLQELKSCLKPGGRLVLESIVVEGPKGYSLMPEQTYARMSNVWFVPTVDTIFQWLTRCGFTDCELVDESLTQQQEQSRTGWMPYESLEDSLNPDSMGLTIEGYPAPRRAVIFAYRP